MKLGMNFIPSKISFPSMFQSLVCRSIVDQLVEAYGPAKRRPPTFHAFDIMAALTFHMLMKQGRLEEHFEQIHGVGPSGSAISQRRELLDFEIFKSVMDHSLKPIATEKEQPEAFFKGRRLLAGDGTAFSVANTAQMLESVPKTQSRRMEAAFVKLGLWTLLEVGVHNPVAAAIGYSSEKSEVELAAEVIGKLPDKSIFLGDRYYGNGKFLFRLQQANKIKAVDFVVRLRGGATAPKLSKCQSLADGSVIGVVIDEDGHEIKVREVVGKLRRSGQKQWTAVRLWTSLLDPNSVSIKELMELYARRWDIEVYYKSVKLDMRGSALLQSHTELSAMQEVAAIVLANALLARQRAAVAKTAKVPPLQISYRSVLEQLQVVWWMLGVAQSDSEIDMALKFANRLMHNLAKRPTPKRRKRSCKRALRQPVTKFPRMLVTDSVSGPIEYDFGIS
jgi:hypothetical protein